jgi:hypothetical protein
LLNPLEKVQNNTVMMIGKRRMKMRISFLYKNEQ